MTRVYQTVADLDVGEGRQAVRTGLALVLAPGIAALTGCGLLGIVVFTQGSAGHVGEVVFGTLYLSFWVGLIGYVTMGIFALPLYCLASEDARQSIFAVTPLAGLAAAAPWLLLSIPTGAFGLVAAAIAFGFGCVGGAAFVLIRGTPPW